MTAVSPLRIVFRLAVGLLLAGGGAARAATPAMIDPASLIVPGLPSWIQPPVELPPPPAVSATSPLRMLVVEEQIDVQRRATFRHLALRVESEGGLQSAGQITVSLAAEYESLQWHFLRIWRDGEKRDVLAPAVLQVLQQEEDADRFMYHGRWSVLALLRDVRVGDVVEYAFTRTGANPVFGGRFSTQLGGAFAMPVDRLNYRIVAAVGRPLRMAALGEFRPELRVAEVDGRQEHRWTAENLDAIRAVSDAPSWAVQYPFVQLTEFGSWGEVAAWGRELFALPPTLAPELLERVESVTKGLATGEAKANAVLRFVQDEMRYLAVHLGESTHRPFAPDEVLRRRFGDCKDKSLLLVALLRHLGFEAHVALVHTEWQQAIAGLLPSPLAFDHAIVHVTLPPMARPLAGSGGLKNLPPSAPPGWTARPERADFGGPTAARRGAPPPASLKFGDAPGELWLDATSTLQGGPWTERHHGNFGYALILAPAADQLRRVEAVRGPGNAVHVKESYTATHFDRPAQLTIATTYRGGMADFYRYYRRQSDPAQAAQLLTGVLGRFFPGVKSLGPITWTDDRETNTLVARSNFEVPDFWTVEAEGKVRAAEVFPWAISERLPRPESTERTAAFALSYPAKVTHEIEVILPKDWPASTDRTSVDDESFRFTSVSEGKGDRVHVIYEWSTLAGAVPARRMAEWSKKMAEVRAALGYRLTQNVRLAAEMKRSGVVWTMAAGLGLGLGAGLALGVWLYRRGTIAGADGPPPLPGSGPVGIQGWLLLPAFGLCVRPFSMLTGLSETIALIGKRPAWIAATDAESVGRIPGYTAVAVAEILVGGLFIAWSAVLAVQFFHRKRSLPISFIAHFSAFAIWGAIHAWWVRQILFADQSPLDKDVMEVVKLFAVAAVWIPYFHLSRRVKRTFTR